ncbi:hypothetical protein M426DRAFT_72954 [Hypoxylon sp. CI-4A]|nr:hypothetical protein M426DRAFT_72954 [Hypoxylon sp. CI-4A]
MASPQLDIAKVAFSAVLFRADPTSCSRAEIDEFLQLLDATISRCSRPNVQKCKQWIVKNLVQSPTRIAALVKYLTALAKSFSQDIAASRRVREPSSKRKRLHILYILNDVLYHTHVRDRNVHFAEKLEPALPDLVRVAAAFRNSPKHTKKVSDLIELWDEKGYFSKTIIQKLRNAVKEAPESISKADAPIGGTSATGTKSSKDAPFIMPAFHGDVTVPWYDLPAANWLPAIEPNSTRPMNPDMIKPLQLTAGPADQSLIDAVQDLLADVDRIYNKDRTDPSRAGEDIDQLGQRIVRDEITGDVIDGESYYGWSRAFCEKMKQRRKKASNSEDDRRGRSMSRSHTRSSSRSLSRPAYKRQRVSNSRTPSRSRTRSQSRSRSRSSYSPGHRQRRSYSSSRSRSHSRGSQYRRSHTRSPRRSPTPQRSYDPPYGGSNGKQQANFPIPNQLPHQNPQYPQPAPPFPHSFPPLPSDPGQYMIPPPLPPPQNYQGQWPPPPPMPPIGGIPPPNMAPSWPQNPAIMGGWPTYPPPPPPPQEQPPYQQGGGFQRYGRGGRGDYRGQGHRGGWDRRGRGGGW